MRSCIIIAVEAISQLQSGAAERHADVLGLKDEGAILNVGDDATAATTPQQTSRRKLGIQILVFRTLCGCTAVYSCLAQFVLVSRLLVCPEIEICSCEYPTQREMCLGNASFSTAATNRTEFKG